MKHFSGKKTVLFRLLLPVALFALMFASGCQGPFDLRTVLGLDLETLTVSPNDIIVDKDIGTLNFNASPAGSYVWTVVSGSGGIDPATGTYTHTGVVEYVTVQAENPATGGFGRARVRFESGVSLQILSQVRSLFPGESTELYAFGGNGGPYVFDIDVNNSGATPIVGSTYIAGSIPGVDDTVRVSDGTTTSTTTITVLDPGAFIPDIDYRVSSVIFTAPGQLGASFIGASFIMENIGTAGGGTAVIYSVYISTSADLTGIIKRIDSGAVGALGAGALSASIPVNGNWPDTPGTYYLVVHLTPAVDVTPANNYGSSVSTVMSVSYNATAFPPAGDVPAAGPIGPLSFSLTNAGSVGGISSGTWKAYLSADGVLGTGDSEIDAGSFGPIAASGTESIPVSGGNWPVSGGPYRVILEWRSADDTATPKTAVSGPQTLLIPVSDYGIISVPLPGGTTEAGGSVAGSFSVQNFGPNDDPGAGFSWSVYASSDNAFNSGDSLIQSGTGGARTVAQPPLVVPYSGFWPETGGEYYIVVVIDSIYDGNAVNDTSFDAAGPTSIVNLTDYAVSAVTFHPLGVAGALLSNRPIKPTVPAAIAYTFQIDEVGGAAGNKKVDYSVYASTDTILGGDTLLKSDFVKATDIGAGGNYTVDFTDGGPWPVFQTFYYLIITINAGDDANAANNIVVAGPVQVPAYSVDGSNNSIGPFPPPAVSYIDLNPVIGTSLNPNELVRVDGTMGAFNTYDTFRFTAGPGMTSMTMKATWPYAFDDIDLYLWTSTGSGELISDDLTDNVEGPMTIIGMTPGNIYFVGVRFWLDNNTSGSAGGNYVLTIQGLP